MEAQTLYNALIEMWEEGLVESAPCSYSGRGMYGASCIAIRLSGRDDVFKVGALLGSLLAGQDDFDPRHPPYCCTDSMGLGIILYWPGQTWDEQTMQERD